MYCNQRSCGQSGTESIQEGPTEHTRKTGIQIFFAFIDRETNLPSDDKLVCASTNRTDFFRIFIRLLLWRGANSRSEWTSLAGSQWVTSHDVECKVRPWLQLDGCRVEPCRHSSPFYEIVRLIKRRVVVDDIIHNRVVIVTARWPLHICPQRSTTFQSDVIWRIWFTCNQMSNQQCD